MDNFASNTTIEVTSVGDFTDRGFNMQLISGEPFWPLAPYPEDFHIEDIAHGLSFTGRYGGHCKKFYSVAQHSLWVSRMVPEEFAMEGLLHDLTEAYVGDLVRPVKYQIPKFIEIENRIWEVAALRFKLPMKMSKAVKDADNWALWTEKRDLLVNTGKVDWGPPREPHPDPIVPITDMYEVKQLFLDRFYELGGE